MAHTKSRHFNHVDRKQRASDVEAFGGLVVAVLMTVLGAVLLHAVV